MLLKSSRVQGTSMLLKGSTMKLSAVLLRSSRRKVLQMNGRRKEPSLLLKSCRMERGE